MYAFTSVIPLAFALLLSQAPEFMRQYPQRLGGERTWEAVQPAKEWIGDVRRKAPAREQHTKHNSAESSHQATKIISVPVTRRSL
jgi:hypothetical protein